MRSDYLPFYAKSCGMRENRGQGRGNPYNASAMFNSERALKFFSCDNEAPATVELAMGKRYANKLKEGLSRECRPITKTNAQSTKRLQVCRNRSRSDASQDTI